MDFKELGKIIKERQEQSLTEFAAKADDAIRKVPEEHNIRLPYAVDRDRIIYSGAYRRYAGKTQVMYFSSLKDEQITTRIIHVHLVSQIARSIGIALGLNLDLIEAAAIGHDLGHTPFGHDGERFLSRQCEKHGIGKFHHNIHSLYLVDEYSHGGKGMNLTFQTRDAIISHNGEIHQTKIEPYRKKTEADIQNYIKGMSGVVADATKLDTKAKVDTPPFTLEGCVIRISDTVAYIGADIEDAIRLEIINRDDIPKNCVEKLGRYNSKIVDSLVKDIISNSYGHDYVAFSKDISDALLELKKFNYKMIYGHEKVKAENKKIEKGFEILFDAYLEDIEKENRNSDIFKHFLDNKKEVYHEKTKPAEKVRDFLASMTDRYFKYQLEKLMIPMVD